MKLLTIAIPTYNREACLDLCLASLAEQLGPFEDEVDVVIFDNGSSDGTRLVVEKYLGTHRNIHYFRNDTNIGSERNFLRCYEAADSHYCWLVGDDDLLMDDALAYLVPLLATKQFRSVFLSAYSFVEDFRKEVRVVHEDRTHVVYDDRFAFLKRVNVDMTFITSNIVDKEALSGRIEPAAFCDTNLVHLGWIFPSIIFGERHLFVERRLIAGKAFNSGGFRFFTVFGTNLNRILSSFIGKGIDQAFHRSLLNKLMIEFYPHRIMTIRSRREQYEDSGEHIFALLYENFRAFPFFWLFTVPAIFLPVAIAKPFCRLQRSVYKRAAKLKALATGTA